MFYSCNWAANVEKTDWRDTITTPYCTRPTFELINRSNWKYISMHNCMSFEFAYTFTCSNTNRFSYNYIFFMFFYMYKYMYMHILLHPRWPTWQTFLMLVVCSSGPMRPEMRRWVSIENCQGDCDEKMFVLWFFVKNPQKTCQIKKCDQIGYVFSVEPLGRWPWLPRPTGHTHMMFT